MGLKTVYFSIFVIACICVTRSDAWVMQAIYHNDAHDGKCFVNENLILNPGQTAKSPEGCSEIRCRNAQGHAEVVGCGSVAPPENCDWTDYVDEEAPYPVCCVQNFDCDSPADEVEAEKLQDQLREMFKKSVEKKGQ